MNDEPLCFFCGKPESEVECLIRGKEPIALICARCIEETADILAASRGGSFQHPASYVPPQPAPIGCICPPAANQTCERMDCPRRRSALPIGVAP